MLLLQFNRVSEQSGETVSGSEYYSTYGQGSGLVDLDLTLPKVLEEIKVIFINIIVLMV